MFVRRYQADSRCTNCRQPITGEAAIIVTDNYQDAGNEKAFLSHPDCLHPAFRDIEPDNAGQLTDA